MWKRLVGAGLAVVLWTGTACAHFGMVIPSRSVVLEKKDAGIDLMLSFSHPMEQEGMTLEKPDCKVIVGGQVQDLSATLSPVKIMGKEGWKTRFTPQRPGVYQIVMTPRPYWEPAEDCFIQHLTKVYVPAFGEEEGWDAPAGLEAEIVPLTRPFGNYAGNVFQGQVLKNGRPVPHAEVEVEFYNRDKMYRAPNEYMVTQLVKADAQGIFTYAVPFAGWWGFAALLEGDQTMSHEGAPKKLELGAVLWMEFVAPRRAR